MINKIVSILVIMIFQANIYAQEGDEIKADFFQSIKEGALLGANKCVVPAGLIGLVPGVTFGILTSIPVAAASSFVGPAVCLAQGDAQGAIRAMYVGPKLCLSLGALLWGATGATLTAVPFGVIGSVVGAYLGAIKGGINAIQNNRENTPPAIENSIANAAKLWDVPEHQLEEFISANRYLQKCQDKILTAYNRAKNPLSQNELINEQDLLYAAVSAHDCLRDVHKRFVNINKNDYFQKKQILIRFNSEIDSIRRIVLNLQQTIENDKKRNSEYSNPKIQKAIEAKEQKIKDNLKRIDQSIKEHSIFIAEFNGLKKLELEILFLRDLLVGSVPAINEGLNSHCAWEAALF